MRTSSSFVAACGPGIGLLVERRRAGQVLLSLVTASYLVKHGHKVSLQYGVPRFRPTAVWPGSVIVPPALTRVAGVEVVGDWVLWPVQSATKLASVELPADFYLRELVDPVLDNLDDVAQLVQLYGPFCSFGFDDLPRAVVQAGSKIVHGPAPDSPQVAGHSWQDVGLRLRAARRAVAIFVASQTDDGLLDFVEPDINDDFLQQVHTDTGGWPYTLDDLRIFLIQNYEDELHETVNMALGRFSIGVGDLTTRNPTIYSVAFLQMYNHLAEKASLRRCANETCGQTFVRQRGRAVFSQHRTAGVKYCSRSCARAQAERELRRRRAAKRSPET